MTTDLATKAASDIVVFSKYARYLEKENRREDWNEIVDRYEGMLRKKYPKLKEDINEACEYVRKKKVLPSMRMLQFAGRAIERGNSRGYNCSYAAASYPQFFRELMFLLLGGSGVGYSVQLHHVSELPNIKKPSRATRFIVGDSIEGWADAVHALFRSFFYGKPLPRFDFSDIRPKGSVLKTAGGKAPGPAPLRICLDKILALLENKKEGSKLEPWEVSDIACYIADAVLSGGIRRAALICLFDIDDPKMLTYKSGAWWELHPERGRVNVSAVALRSETTKEQFLSLWEACKESGAGEPGISWTNNKELGANPCHEISLRHKQFCNLTTINFSNVRNQRDFNNRVWAASFLGTLQAGFTDFHYLTQGWEDNCKEEALLGVSITGLADNPAAEVDFEKGAKVARETNAQVAKDIGINKAARITCVKPEGTASLVLGSSSGVHGRHAPYYVRRFRFNKTEPIAEYLTQKLPKLVVEDLSNPEGIILELPQKSPEGSVMRDEPALSLLERARGLFLGWIKPGHRSGDNTHNVSVTASLRPEDWEPVGEWMWENRESYNGISVLPFDGGSYKQAPFETCDKAKYDEMMEHVKAIDLTQVREFDDITELKGEIACGGGACELK